MHVFVALVALVFMMILRTVNVSCASMQTEVVKVLTELVGGHHSVVVVSVVRIHLIVGVLGNRVERWLVSLRQWMVVHLIRVEHRLLLFKGNLGKWFSVIRIHREISFKQAVVRLSSRLSRHNILMGGLLVEVVEELFVRALVWVVIRRVYLGTQVFLFFFHWQYLSD